MAGRDAGVVLGGGGGGGGRVWEAIPSLGRSDGGPFWHIGRLGLVDDGPAERFGDPIGKVSTIEVPKCGFGMGSILRKLNILFIDGWVNIKAKTMVFVRELSIFLLPWKVVLLGLYDHAWELSSSNHNSSNRY